MSFKGALFGSALLAIASPGFAWAADAAAPDLAVEIETLVVTARKREEDLQKVPVAITAVPETMIRERTLSELKDIQEISPNVLFTENTGLKGTSRVFIRGIGENTLIFSSDPAVGIYVDGIPLSRAVGSNVGLLDVARLEVLRGPQGTTFGKNTIGGSINFVTKTPGSEFSADVIARYGNYQNVSLQAAADLPLAEYLAVRLSGARNSRDGFVENTFPGGPDLSDLDNWSGRAVVNWDPTEALNLVFSADYFRRDEASNVPQLLSYNPASPLVLFFDNAALNRYGFRPFPLSLDNDPFRGFYSGGASVAPGQPSIVAADPLRSRYDLTTEPNTTRQRIWGTYLIATLDLTEQLQLKSLTSYRKIRSAAWFDSFGTAIPLSGTVLEENSEETSQELQLLGSDLAGGRLSFVAGVFYGVTEAVERGTLFFEPELMASVFNLSTIRDQSQETTSMAVFGNASFELTEKLQLTLGARWTQDEKDFHRAEFAAFPTGADIGFGPALPPARPNAGGAPFIFDAKKKWPAWSGVAALQYQWTPEVMTYVSWSRGFRSGGFSGGGRSLLEVQPYDPEFVDAYEAGFRTSALGRRLILNGTAYLMEYTDRQMASVLVDTSVTPFVSRLVVFNAGESEQKGVELELFARPTDFWDLSAAYGLTDAKYTALRAPLSLGSTVANDLKLELPQTPKHTFNVSSTWRAQLPGTPGEVSFNLNWNYRSKVYYDVANSENIAQKGYGLFNARLSWRSADRSLELAGWIRNIADKRYRTDGVNVAGNFAAGYFGEPRTYGVEIRKTFD